MKKNITIFAIVMIFASQIFAVEFILGEKHARRNSAADTATDSSIYIRDTAFYMDSAEVAALTGIRGQTMSGQRSRANIMRGIDKNQNTIRKEYQNYIRQGNFLNGGMIVRFKIISSGEVIDVKIVESNTNDVAFEKGVALAVKKWQFLPIEIENDTTIVEYPFVFEQIN